MRPFLRLLLTVGAGLPAVSTAAAGTLPPIGLWQGHYVCAQGDTALALEITATSLTRVKAVFYFHALASNTNVPPGCFAMTGSFNPATRRITLVPSRWLSRPPFYVWTGLSGDVSPGGSAIKGTIQGPACSAFSLTPSAAPPVPPAPPACRLDQNGPTV